MQKVRGPIVKSLSLKQDFDSMTLLLIGNRKSEKIFVFDTPKDN